ncbi:unnamed protein product [Musa acuminata subsp. malaccensis]|uniref:(wild Malaysian banana) hypothetical protein n=1 Tax=Musa acuminata subsp. malaccensis TaxID=214687 RepID=A0A804J413_MUSAM|nr:unnamed protein product [Musa acuminata subsp. malaccensis]
MLLQNHAGALKLSFGSISWDFMGRGCATPQQGCSLWILLVCSIAFVS